MGKNLLREKKRLIRQKILFLTGENESWMKKSRNRERSPEAL